LVDGKRREQSFGGEHEMGVESFLLAEKSTSRLRGDDEIT
jgi:hypothetical protein